MRWGLVAQKHSAQREHSLSGRLIAPCFGAGVKLFNH